jgi:hypothetical protein
VLAFSADKAIVECRRCDVARPPAKITEKSRLDIAFAKGNAYESSRIGHPELFHYVRSVRNDCFEVDT